MNVQPSLITNSQPAEAVEPGERALTPTALRCATSAGFSVGIMSLILKADNSPTVSAATEQKTGTSLLV